MSLHTSHTPRLLYGGVILTMTPDFERCSRPEALLTDADGRIAFVGSLDEARAHARSMTTSVQERDLQGATLLPGLIDPHSHFSGISQYFTAADLTRSTSIDDIVMRLRYFALRRGVSTSDDGVILGVGYDTHLIAERRHPNRHDLDRVSTDVPVLAVHVSSHMLVANSKALDIAGITRDTPDPAGARFGREVDGTPDGLCQEPNAIFAVYRALGSRMNVDPLALADDMQDEYLSHGITTAQDGATTAGWADNLDTLAQRERLRLDVVSYPMYGEPVADILAQHRYYVGPRYVNHLRIGGLKLILDGSPQGRTAWVSEAYTPGPEGTDFHGNQAVGDDAAYDFARTAIDSGLQLMAHCNGDAASEQFLDVYERAYADSPNAHKDGLRPVMVHCQLTRRDQFARMPALHMVPSFFVSHCWYWGDAHLRNFGPARGRRISAVRDAADFALPFTFHTDSPIIRPNLLEAVWCAASRRTSNGVLLDESQRIGVADGLRAITANAAFQYGEEHDKGTLEAGKLADLCVLERNPLTVPIGDDGAPEPSLRDIHVVRTYKEGDQVWPRNEDESSV
ncbi:amidohydrolase [Bifidobacterium callitrichos DSM 23973]|uniref:Amidohydrolase n=2 Tax=Bifidobacterium callitrichos TaxID=762209 RepID=A0A087A5Q2_9BIFI|nr:amidohydrolase [Bifidobacterium callitrichos DSM 23973]